MNSPVHGLRLLVETGGWQYSPVLRGRQRSMSRDPWYVFFLGLEIFALSPDELSVFLGAINRDSGRESNQSLDNPASI